MLKAAPLPIHARRHPTATEKNRATTGRPAKPNGPLTTMHCYARSAGTSNGCEIRIYCLEPGEEISLSRSPRAR